MRWFRPSLSDCLFAALLLWMLVFTWAGGDGGLLHDAGAGVHIRTGEYILDSGSIPRRDIFSFSRPGAPWFAWEWLADVQMALLFRWAGFKGIVLVFAAAIAFAFWISMRHSLVLGANPLVAVAVLHLGIGASSHHFLARPHALTLLFMAVLWWWLEQDESNGAQRSLLPLTVVTVLWTNLHGGFVALPVSLAALAAGKALEALGSDGRGWARWRPAVRYLKAACLCGGVALLNPWGTDLFVHLAGYLRAGWVREMVEEFQPPRIGTASAVYFEILLFLALGAATLLAVRGRWAPAVLIAVWTHAALTSVRHMPILFLVSGPFIAAEITALWRRLVDSRPASSLASLLWCVGESYRPQFQCGGLAGLALVGLLALPVTRDLWPRNFPESRFPVSLVTANRKLLAGERVLTSDTWGDYLAFELYPRQKVYFDGRSDFYGPELSREYLRLIEGGEGWREIAGRYGFRFALLPENSRLAVLLSSEAGWRERARRSGAVLLYREAEAQAQLPRTVGAEPGT